MAKANEPQARVRDADATRARILKAATREFATLGLGGGRIDMIAERAKANKRMIYHYFGDKEGLFTAVLEKAYLDIREAERKLNLDAMEPEQAMDALVEFTWRYYLKHPEFLNLVNSENLHKARHLKASDTVREQYPSFLELVKAILARGVAKGVFRDGIDPVQLNITLAAVNHHYLTNQYTGSIIYARKLADPEMLEARLRFNIDTIRRLVQVRPDDSANTDARTEGHPGQDVTVQIDA